MSWRRFVAFFLLLICPRLAAAESGPAELVLVQRGTLPVILTAPHGGRAAIPGVAVRNIEGRPKGAGKNQYNLGGDPGTDVLALGIAAEIKALTGNDVYFVVAKFDRKYIDANRPPAVAYDNPAARPYYDLYHGSIRSFIDEIRNTAGGGVLIDVHGQGKDRNVVMRGTHNGRAVKTLLARHGDAAIIGPRGLFGQLEAQGFAVFPSNLVPPAGTSEDAGFKGGYTVWRYGSHTASGIDTVQIEFGTTYRQKATLEPSAKNAARAIVGFYETYLRKNQRR